MHIMKLDPRALKDNPDDTRRTKSTPQSDALMLATIRAVGIVQPPVVSPQTDGGNGYVIQAGHRRVKQAIAAGLEEINVVVVEAANDNGAMRSMIENIAREPLNGVDQWRGIERLVALGWTEEGIGVALALPLRQIRKLRLLANILPAMLDQMALGDMPNEQQLRTIAAASLDEQREVWKANKPKKSERAEWYNIARALSKTRMFAKDASFGDDLAAAYGVEWVEDLFGPADEDNRHTINVEGFLGAQQEWMTSNLPKKGSIVEVNNYGQPDLPKKAERVYGKPSKSDHVAMYLDRDGKVQSVHFRMSEAAKPKGKGGKPVADGQGGNGAETVVDAPKPRPDVTQAGLDMIGDFRTDALHDALSRAPIEDDTLMALLVLAFAGMNMRVDSGANDNVFGPKRFKRHAARLFDGDGTLSCDMDTLRIAARSTLIEVLSCRRGMSQSGVVSRIAGNAIGADSFLPNMGTEDFLNCLSRQALEAAANEAKVLPRQRVRDTRAAVIEHFKEGHYVHSSALFAPDPQEVADLMKHAEFLDQEDDAADSDGTADAGEPDGLDPEPEDADGLDDEGEDASNGDDAIYGTVYDVAAE